ncbi:uncharacterized protein [Amphiura filiformis]|uniref:uncharacterized protein n=1 Tax=Amphiura filiformis TaxID=82378 RepID=UPI003B2187F6
MSDSLNIFREEVNNHLKKCHLSTSKSSSKSLEELLTILSRPPAYTVLRVNTLYYDRQEVKQQLQQVLSKQYENRKHSVPTVEEHNELSDTLIIPSQNVDSNDVIPVSSEVIVDSLCAVAVLRGADIFAPGVMGAPAVMQVGDTVAVYGDLCGQCRRGYTQAFTGEKMFLGNGKALMSRSQLFVETEKPSGVAIKMTEPIFDCPSLNSVLTDRIFLQNLPSIVAGHVVSPQPGDMVLDMCAAPGGKTTHLATLMQNTGVLVALDKSAGKIKRIQENAAKLKLDMVKSYAYDSTKSCKPHAQLVEGTWNPPYPPGTFDRILLDAPCSGLGQRPQIKNNITLKDLQSYPPYQRKLFATAVELLKPGGVLVYSTCTITTEENEGLVQWALNTFPDMQLAPQIPHLGGSGMSSPDLSLTDTQLKLLQRFDPSIIMTTSSVPKYNMDTIGFFVAKFVKQNNRRLNVSTMMMPCSQMIHGNLQSETTQHYDELKPTGKTNLASDHHHLTGQMVIVNEAVSRIRAGRNIIQLTGLPLVGKSYIAQKVAEELSQNALYWFSEHLEKHVISLRGMKAIQNIRQAVMDVFGCTDPGIAENPRKFWKALESTPGMHLFVFENAEIVDKYDDFRDDFLFFCTSLCYTSKRLHLVITSRIQFKMEREVDTFHSIEVQPLSTEESRQLFRSVAGDVGLWEHQLVPLCAGIPHVLIITARTIRDDIYTPDEIFSLLKSSKLGAFAIDATEHTKMHEELEKCVKKLTNMYLKKRCVDLAYIPGTFNPEAAAYITGVSVAVAKHDVISPLHSLSLILQGDSQCERFQIHTFVKALLEDRFGFFRDESLIRNRYCKFFAQLLQRLAPLADRSRGQKFHLITQELTNLEKLLQQAVHLIDEHYELFFDIAYNAEYHIINLMPKKESVDFYEAIMHSAKLRDPRQCGILLSSFGQVLNFAQTRYSKAYDQYRKALEYLRPLGDSHDLAWLYSHIGYYWFDMGHTKKAERYMRIAYNMIKRVRKQVDKDQASYQERGMVVSQGMTQMSFMTDRFMGCIQSSLGILYTDIGRAEEAVQYHTECLELRQIIYGFHPTLGSCYNNLSEAYEKSGDLGRALETARIGMRIKKYFIKDPSNAVIESLITVARLTTKTGGDSSYALGLLREAYEMRRELGLPHMQAAEILHDIGMIWYRRGIYQKSVEAFQGAIVMLGQIECTSRQRGDNLRMLGLSLQANGQITDAAEKLTNSIQEQERIPDGERTEEDAV